ncbi:MAG: SDR family NAD(P)-dependent oxidoreductase [Candidatus Limnocylindrales bacterium]
MCRHRWRLDATDPGPHRGARGTALAVETDVSTVAGNRTMIAAALDCGGLDVFHANAAIQVMGGLEATSEDDWDALHAANLRGVYLGVREALLTSGRAAAARSSSPPRCSASSATRTCRPMAR